MLLDNGRTAALADEVGRQALHCIRCSACLNVCPVYERTGGHAYGSVYPGPIGAILTPQLTGRRHDEQRSLPYASTLCGACYDVCPVRSTSRLLVHLRAAGRRRPPRRHRAHGRGGGDGAAAWAMADAGRHGSWRTRRRPRGSPRPSPRDAGWSPRAVLAALARVALDPGPRLI